MLKDGGLGRLLSGACFAGQFLVFGTAAAAQTSDANEFWPQVNAYTQLGRTTRLLGYTDLDEGEDFPYSQWKVDKLSFQLKPLRDDLHLRDIDSDKNHHLPLAVGYDAWHHPVRLGDPRGPRRRGRDAGLPPPRALPRPRSEPGRVPLEGRASTRRGTGTGCRWMPPSAWGRCASRPTPRATISTPPLTAGTRRSSPSVCRCPTAGCSWRTRTTSARNATAATRTRERLGIDAQPLLPQRGLTAA